MKRTNVPNFPAHIFLEPSNACNLRCRMCPAYGEGVQRKREVGFIRREVWLNAIEEIGSWPSHVNVDLHGVGEPLLHPDFFDIVSYAKGRRNITIGFLCNGTLFDENKARAAVELDVDWIGFSVDGAQKEIFEHHRKGAVLDVVEENINYLLSLRKNDKPYIFFNMVAHVECDVNAFIRKWTGRVDSITISLKRPVRREENKRLKLIRPCPSLFQQLGVGWSGKAGLCCEDYWIDNVVGEFPAVSLYDIWHGNSFNKARELHESGRFEEIVLCKMCDSIFFHQYNTTVLEENGRRTVIRKELVELNLELAVPLMKK